MDKKIKIELGIAIAAIMIITAGVFGWMFTKKVQSPTQPEVANQVVTPAVPITQIKPKEDAVGWQVYRNEKYGFELKYPSGYEVGENGVQQDSGPDFGMETFYISSLKENIEFRGGLMEIGVSSRPKNIVAPGDRIIEEDKIINGVRFESFSDPGMCNPYGYSTKHGAYYYYIDISCEGEGKRFEKILSTLKFFEPVDISSWKTYKNDKYGFEFRYPKDFDFNGEEVAEGDLYLIGNFMNNSGGHLGLVIKNTKLDPNTVEGFLGKVNRQDLETIIVDNVLAYAYVAGDPGCGGHYVSIPIGSNTLEMSFVDCDEGFGVEPNRGKILSTFKFTK